jgi:hypothetical protein
MEVIERTSRGHQFVHFYDLQLKFTELDVLPDLRLFFQIDNTAGMITIFYDVADFVNGHLIPLDLSAEVEMA